MPTVKSYELHRAMQKMKAELIKLTDIERIKSDIRFVNTSSECVNIRVMLWDCRMMSPEATCKFADCLVKAAKLAEEFKYNGYKVTYK